MSTADIRATLYTALGLSPVLAGRVHRWRPDELATPCVYIDRVARRLVDDQGAGLTVTLSVVTVVDGADQSQLQALDDWGDAVWYACAQVGTPVIGAANELDVGGPNLRAETVDVDVDAWLATLCPPTAPIPEESRHG